VAFRARDYVRGGGIDESEVFRGDASALTYFAESLWRAGVPLVRLDGMNAVAEPPSNLVGDTIQSSRSCGRIAAAKIVWPQMFDGSDLRRKWESPRLLESTRFAEYYKIVRWLFRCAVSARFGRLAFLSRCAGIHRSHSQ
jgi:hypothetical protein